MVDNHQKPWSNIIKNHGQQSSKTMVNNRQKSQGRNADMPVHMSQPPVQT
jgi:ribosomal protein L13E